MVSDRMGMFTPSMFCRSDSGVSLGGVAIVSCQFCRRSCAVGSCG